MAYMDKANLDKKQHRVAAGNTSSSAGPQGGMATTSARMRTQRQAIDAMQNSSRMTSQAMQLKQLNAGATQLKADVRPSSPPVAQLEDGDYEDDGEHGLVTTVKSEQELNEALARFKAESLGEQGRPTVFISGASINGSMTAAMAREMGANVLMVESREEFSRQNVVALKEEALYTMAMLSGGGLPGKLQDSHRLSFRQSRIDPGSGGTLIEKPTPDKRFADWLSPEASAQSRTGRRRDGAWIPERTGKRDTMPAIIDPPDTRQAPLWPTLENKQDGTAKTTIAGLDLAWPAYEPVKPVPHAEWRYDDLSRISDSSLAISPIKDLEAGLNRFLVGTNPSVQPQQEGVQGEPHEPARVERPPERRGRVDIMRGAVEIVLQESDDGGFYVPRITLPDGKVVLPDFKFDLIHLAEGAQSKNAARIGKMTAKPRASLEPRAPTQEDLLTVPVTDSSQVLSHSFGETWFQRNYQIDGKQKAGSSVVPPQSKGAPLVVPIRANQKQGEMDKTLVNIAYLANESPWEDQAARTRQVLEASGLTPEHGTVDPLWESNPIGVTWRRHQLPADRNLTIGGDAASSKSPIAGAGASLAASAYPEMIRRLMTSPTFKGTAEDRAKLNEKYIEQARQVSDVWQDKSVRLMIQHGKLSGTPPDDQASTVSSSKPADERFNHLRTLRSQSGLMASLRDFHARLQTME